MFSSFILDGITLSIKSIVMCLVAVAVAVLVNSINEKDTFVTLCEQVIIAITSATILILHFEFNQVST